MLLIEELGESDHASGSIKAPVQLKETASMDEQELRNVPQEQPTSVFTISDKFSHLEESEVVGTSLPSYVPFNSETLGSVNIEAGKGEVELESHHSEFELPNLTVENDFSVYAASNDASQCAGKENMVNYEHTTSIACQIYGNILQDSVREGLYTFFETKQSAMQSIENGNAIKSSASKALISEANSITSLRKYATVNGVELLAKSFRHPAVINSKVAGDHSPQACHKEGSVPRRQESGDSRNKQRNLERRMKPQDRHRTSLGVPLPNGKHVRGKNLPSAYQSAYNRLLKSGRLNDCIELLEELERMNLLDMNRVYHARFFEICRTQKAIKEAFRFCQLIPNPTLSTFNMLTSVCAHSQDSEGAFQALRLAQEAGLKADCKLYTTLISTCAKSGKVDAMFEVFHEMVNAKVEPNVHTYGALIDGCARAGQVAKAFGAYGIMRSKVKPDRVVFNALITACGQSGAVDRAFDVLAEMRAETQPIDPDHVTVGALIKACSNACQIDRAQEVYKMIHEYNIKGTPEVYTIAVNSCSQTGDWEFACSVYNDMKRKGVAPDEMFLSALIDVAGHSGKLDSAFEVLQEARNQGIRVGIMTYSSLMGACSKAKNWKSALELYDEIKSMNLKPTVSTMNALITALCDGDQLQKAVEVLQEMKRVGLSPNVVTYSILLVATEKNDDLEVGLKLLSQAKKDSVTPNTVMSRCLTGMCMRRYEKACTMGERVMSSSSGTPLALKVYRETIVSGVIPTEEIFSHVLGCLRLPQDASLRTRFVEDLGGGANTSSHQPSLLDGFGEYDSRAFSLFEGAASLGIVPSVSFKDGPIVIDARQLHIYTAEVYLLTVLKGLKHRLAAGAKLPNITVLLPIEKTQILSPTGEKTINLAGRLSQRVAALLRRLRLPYQGNESYGKIRINGLAVKRWFQPKPKLAFPFSGKPTEMSLSQLHLGKGIIHQQRNIRMGNLSLE
ncbi:Pentacotripeptide-repeat region of PRORP [Dillenia turbinata]|uniref:Pentacotripeptide-repeat region of PRORP n=1 Tax=Dillenia turbinata TaxID=194707 RepID=A0AAN8UJM7_9MAGN